MQFPLLEFLRTKTTAVHSDDIVRHLTKATFPDSYLSEKAKVKVRGELSWMLTRMHRLGVISLHDGFVIATHTGASITADRLEALNLEHERLEREERKAKR